MHKRRRIMDAMAELSAEQGYEATKIADIVRRAGVARKTLYDNFDGKEELFLAAFDSAVDEVRGRGRRGLRRAPRATGRSAVEAGLRALLDYVAEHPAAARMCMIEALSATPAAAARYDDALQRFVELLRADAPPGRPACRRRSRRRWSAASPGSSTSRSAAARPSRRPSCCPSCPSSCFRRTTV